MEGLNMWPAPSARLGRALRGSERAVRVGRATRRPERAPRPPSARTRRTPAPPLTQARARAPSPPARARSPPRRESGRPRRPTAHAARAPLFQPPRACRGAAGGGERARIAHRAPSRPRGACPPTRARAAAGGRPPPPRAPRAPDSELRVGRASADPQPSAGPRAATGPPVCRGSARGRGRVRRRGGARRDGSIGPGGSGPGRTGACGDIPLHGGEVGPPGALRARGPQASPRVPHGRGDGGSPSRRTPGPMHAACSRTRGAGF
jgi:hypothetical protein